MISDAPLPGHGRRGVWGVLGALAGLRSCGGFSDLGIRARLFCCGCRVFGKLRSKGEQAASTDHARVFGCIGLEV